MHALLERKNDVVYYNMYGKKNDTGNMTGAPFDLSERPILTNALNMVSGVLQQYNDSSKGNNDSNNNQLRNFLNNAKSLTVEGKEWYNKANRFKNEGMQILHKANSIKNEGMQTFLDITKDNNNEGMQIILNGANFIGDKIQKYAKEANLSTQNINKDEVMKQITNLKQMITTQKRVIEKQQDIQADTQDIQTNIQADTQENIQTNTEQNNQTDIQTITQQDIQKNTEQKNQTNTEQKNQTNTEQNNEPDTQEKNQTNTQEKNKEDELALKKSKLEHIESSLKNASNLIYTSSDIKARQIINEERKKKMCLDIGFRKGFGVLKKKYVRLHNEIPKNHFYIVTRIEKVNGDKRYVRPTLNDENDYVYEIKGEGVIDINDYRIVDADKIPFVKLTAGGKTRKKSKSRKKNKKTKKNRKRHRKNKTSKN